MEKVAILDRASKIFSLNKQPLAVGGGGAG